MHHFASCYIRVVTALCLLCCLGRQVPAYAGVRDGVLVKALQTQIMQPDNVSQALAMDWTYLERLYGLRQYAPVWTSMNGPNQRASILRQFLYVADQEGLTPQAFHLSAIESIWHRHTAADLAALDILLSDAFFRYATQVRTGRLLPGDIDQQWHLGTPQIHPVKLLQKMLTSKDFETGMRSLAPPQSGYQRLREALAQYRQLAARDAWPRLSFGTTLRPGMHSAKVVILRKRLSAEGDLPNTAVANPRIFDPILKFAVDRFQVRHGLKMDGIVGPATRRAMNVSIADRITQIKLNMERWRWLPRHLGARYLIVNTAGYNLTAFDQGRARFSMWVVIGKQDRQTPEIKGSLHTVVFNPYWTVPTTIAVEDLIPAQLRNPHYLQVRKIRVFASLSRQIEVDPRKVHWAQYTKENFPYVLRQDPGPYNPLGRYKFLFSNGFDVYLHDTPTRQLFAQKQRTFSSGCIRVENPLQLAKFLLAANPGWDAARIRATVASGQTSEVKLAKSLPIYLVYLTAWVGPDNAVHFYPDVYARDQAIAECVSSSRHPQRDIALPCVP